MARITTPTGQEFDETTPGALDYYRREPGYFVDGVDATVVGDVPAADGGSEPGAFDPGEHTVEDVLAYLDGVTDDERDRVLAAEAAGKDRKGIVGE